MSHAKPNIDDLPEEEYSACYAVAVELAKDYHRSIGTPEGESAANEEGGYGFDYECHQLALAMMESELRPISEQALYPLCYSCHQHHDEAKISCDAVAELMDAEAHYFWH